MRLSAGVALAAMSVALRAGAQPSAGFPTEPPPSQAPPPPAPAAQPQTPPPGYVAPVQPVQPVYGPYQRPPWQPKDEAAEREDYVRVGPPGVYRHDGFYMRLAGGIGSGRDSAESSEDFDDFDTGEPTSFDAAGSGFAAATEIAVGFTTSFGLVLGAGVYTAVIPALEMDGATIGSGKYEFATSQLALFSPFADFYPDPDAGLHFQGGFGFAVYVAGQAYPATSGEDARAHTATGPGFMLGVGYEWWVAEQWSLGLLGRVLYAWTDGTDPESVSWSHKTLSPTLMVTATYH